MNSRLKCEILNFKHKIINYLKFNYDFYSFRFLILESWKIFFYNTERIILMLTGKCALWAYLLFTYLNAYKVNSFKTYRHND